MTYIEFKPGAKHASVGADRSDDMATFKDCGYLLERDDIVVDIDHLDKKIIREMIDFFGIETQTVWTDRGAHLYFKKPDGFVRAKNGVCPLGFDIEMKTSSNTPNGITVKRNGIPRKMENEGEFQELPWYLNRNKQYKSLVGLDDNDGRNNALYAHKMKLANHEGWLEVLYFINNYVFAKPLDTEEFKTLTRRETIDPKDASLNQIAETIMNDRRCVTYRGLLWWYDEQLKEYVTDGKNLGLKSLVYKIVPNVKTKDIDEIVKQITYKAKRFDSDAVFPIKFNNGVLMSYGKWGDMEYTDFTPYYIQIEYDPEAEPVGVVDEYIDNLTGHDSDYRKALLEALAFVLVTDPERIRSLGKFWIFRGDGRNGKGTLLQIMGKIYNDKNCTNLSIKQLADPRYNITMVGKLANLGDDIEGDAIDNSQMKMLKNIVTADGVTSRRLYEQSESVTFTTKLYFTTNSNIKSYEKGYAYKRRVVWMPMFNKVDRPDPRFITKLTTKAALKYWIRLIMEGYFRLIENGEWTKSEVLEQYNADYHESNNPMMLFAKDVNLKTEILGRTVNEVKAAFEDWKDDDEYKFNAKLLKQALWELHDVGVGVKKINGKSKKIFMHKSETDQDLTPK